jgi:predicted RecB family nuclease
VSWDPSASQGELDAFGRFWDWFQGQRAACRASGRTLRAYCYSKAAENGQMRRLAAQLDVGDEVDDFVRSDQWVDLLEVFRDQLITGRRIGLKRVAPLAGFRWRGDEAGGGQAMVRFAEAVGDVDSATRSEARRWILEYNEDDVRATAALRDWLDGAARLLPSVADIRP